MKLDLSGYQIPPLEDWQDFERLCRDLWAEIWSDKNAQRNGRGGQAQAGVDVYGRRSHDGATCGVQCKRRGANDADSGKITEKTLRAEVEKAKTFVPSLQGEYVLAFTGKRDEASQTAAREITEEHRRHGLFDVYVYSWDDITDQLGNYPEVWMKHYGSMVATVQALIARCAAVPELPEAKLQRPSTPASVEQSPRLISSDVGAAIEDEYLAEIELIRSALKGGNVQAALTQAESLRNRIWNGAKGETRVSLEHLIGHALMAGGDETGAAGKFVDALQYAPGSEKAQAYAAWGHAILGATSAAKTWAEKALAQNPVNTLAMQVSIANDERSDDEILSEWESIVGERPELFSVLGQRAAVRGELGVAVQRLERAAAHDDAHPEILVHAAQLLINIVTEEVRQRVHETPEDRRRLTRAVHLLDRALAQPGDEGVRRARLHWYFLRVTAKHMLRSGDAAEAADDAMRDCGHQPELLRLRTAIAADCGDNAKVLTLLAELPEPHGVDDMGLAAAALANLGRHGEAEHMWRRILESKDLPDVQLFNAKKNHALTLLLLGREVDAKNAVEQGLAAQPTALIPILVAIAVYERLEDNERRNTLLDTAIGLAGTDSPFLQSLVADALCRAEKWSEAADIYGRVVPEGAGGVYATRHIRALFQAGRYESVLRRCDAVESAAGPSEFVAEMRAATYESLGDLKQAVSACRAYLAFDVDSSALQLRLATVLFRQGEKEEAGRVIATMDFGRVDSVHGALALAQVLVGLSRPLEAVDIAYRVRRANLDSLEAQVGYVSLYTSVKHELPPVDREGVVSCDCAVELKGVGAPGWVLLCSEGNADVAQYEYPRSHQLSRSLIGKHVGEKIVAGGNEWEIAGIGSKYGFAFGRTFASFAARFPTSDVIQTQRVPEDGDGLVAHFQTFFANSNARRDEVVAKYHEGKIGIGCLASILNRSAYESLAIALTSPGGLVAFTNSVEEQDYSLRLLSSDDATLVLDLTAVVTLDGLGVLRDGTLKGRKLVVAQRTLDALQREVQRWQDKPRDDAMYIGLEDGHLVRYSATAEELESSRRQFVELVDWIRANVQIVGVPPGVAERYASIREIGPSIGECFWDTICIGSQPGMIVVSDDLWLRRLGKTSLNSHGVCSAMLLMSELRAGRLPQSQFDDAIAKMALSGYRWLPVSGAILEVVARFDQWQTGAGFRRALSALEGPQTSPESAAIVAAEFIRRVWLGVPIAQRRSIFLMAVLETLCVGRTRASVLSQFVNVVERLFALHPLGRDEIVRIVNGWDAMKIAWV